MYWFWHGNVQRKDANNSSQRDTDCHLIVGHIDASVGVQVRDTKQKPTKYDDK